MSVKQEESVESMFTSTQVCAAFGIPPNTLQRWINDGHIAPSYKGGYGPGKGKRYDLPTALGIGVATKVYNSERGCNLSYIGVIVRAFAKLTDPELHDLFKSGRYFWCVVEGNVLLTDKCHVEVIDVRTLYYNLKGKVHAKGTAEDDS